MPRSELFDKSTYRRVEVGMILACNMEIVDVSGIKLENVLSVKMTRSFGRLANYYKFKESRLSHRYAHKYH